MIPSTSLNIAQSQTLEAIVSRIIPADDTPGAVESGVLDYISAQLQGDMRGKISLYQAGLEATNAESLACYNCPFVHLPALQQDTLLTNLEQGQVRTPWPVSSREFFLMLVNHTAEGFYSDPAGGGNRDALSWKMIGF